MKAGFKRNSLNAANILRIECIVHFFQFKEMLRELSMIKDSHGQYKFNPKSVIFIANFWDKVKAEEKPVCCNT